MIIVHYSVWYKFLSLKELIGLGTFEFGVITVLIASAFFLSTVSAWKSQFSIKQWRILIENLPENPGNNPGRLIWYSIIIMFGIGADIHIHYGMTTNPGMFIYEEIMSPVYVVVTINCLFANRLLKTIQLKAAEVKLKLQAEIVTYNTITLRFKSNDNFQLYLSISKMDKIVTSFLGILRAIESFNKIFGVTMIGLGILATMSISNTMFIIFIRHVHLEPYFMHCLLIKKFIINFGYLVYCFLYIQPCVKTTSHLKEAVQTTCRLSSKLSHNATDPSCSLLRRKLDLLNKQLTMHEPYFSPADTFDVDYTIFVYIFAGVSSVVVGYVQLK
nr:unnamed protein product [Callosobruchus analis]